MLAKVVEKKRKECKTSSLKASRGAMGRCFRRPRSYYRSVKAVNGSAGRVILTPGLDDGGV